MSRERKIGLSMVAVFPGLHDLPIEATRFPGARIEAFRLAKGYAREHVRLCRVPALFIAGAIGAFVSPSAAMKYFGPRAPKWLSYSVASISGTILAVCSCTVLPLFGGIHLHGAGRGPALALSLPGMIVTLAMLGARKSLTFVGLVESWPPCPDGCSGSSPIDRSRI